MRRGAFLLIVLLALAAGSARRHSARVASPARPRSGPGEVLTLVGYRSPWEPEARSISLAGAWSSWRGWLVPPDDRFPPAWQAPSWQLFSLPGARVVAVWTSPVPVPAEGEVGPFYAGDGSAGAGVAVARAVNPRPRRARSEAPDRAELRRSTRELLAEYGIPVPAHPRIREAYRVDLNGDGRDEVLWTARSRDDWVSPYLEGPGHARAGDYALLGLRYLTPRGVRSVALALAAAGDDCDRYRLFPPLDLNRDSRMEILAHRQGFEDDSLLVYTFDGARVAGILGTRLPNDEATNDDR